MDHSNHSGMNMGMMTTATSTAAMASDTASSMAGMNHSGMDHGGMGGGCKISMLWNWYTVDSCFLSRSWHVTSKGMFAGSCIGVILLVICLEFLRRAGKEYDRHLLAQHNGSSVGQVSSTSSLTTPDGKGAGSSAQGACPTVAVANQTFRPNVLQQAIRALLHMLQFAVAYFIMLLAMYYNGYIIICIFIGAYIGYFIFGWETMNVRLGGRDRLQEEVTVCCG